MNLGFKEKLSETDELARTKLVITISSVLNEVQKRYPICRMSDEAAIKLLDLLNWLNEQVEE